MGGQVSANLVGLLGSGPGAGEAVGRGGGFFRGPGQAESTAFLTVRHDTLCLRSSSRILVNITRPWTWVPPKPVNN
jgi:hypothetical protein